MPERGRHVQVGRIDGAEGGSGRHYQERGCAERLGQHDADDRIGEVSVEQPTQKGVRPHQIDQQDAAHQRGKGQRQQYRHSDERGHPTGRPGQEVGQRDPEQRDQDERDRGRLERNGQRGEQSG